MPRASSFLVIALGVMAVTHSGAVFFFLACVFSSTGSRNCPSDPKKNSPGSGGRLSVLRVAERGDASAASRTLASALALLLLKHE